MNNCCPDVVSILGDCGAIRKLDMDCEYGVLEDSEPLKVVR